MKWYRKAAEQGFDAAQFNLGFMYEYGQGVAAEDYAQAVTWYRKAAEQGYAKAQYSLGVMYRTSMGVARDYARERQTFGKPIADRQAIQFMLADSAMEIHAGRLMVYDGARRLDGGERVTREAAITKVFCSEMAGRIADRALQIFGGMGYMKDLPVELMYRDLRNHRIAEGTSEILRLVIARDVLKT